MRPALIIGSKGQVAKSLAAQLKGQAFSTTSRDANAKFFLDLEQAETIGPALKAWTRSLPSGTGDIYLSGAWTAVDACEQNPARSFKINVEGPREVARLAKELGHRLLYFSTEYVFGAEEFSSGKIGPFTESDKPAPLGVYGQHKWQAEQAVQAYLPEALIVRTTMVFSFDAQGMNFAMQVYRALTSEVPDNPIRVPMDQISTPTYAPALVSACQQLFAQNAQGIYHVTGSDLLSRPQFIEKVAQAFRWPLSRIAERYSFVKTNDLQQSAKRPLAAGLNCDKLNKMGIKVWSLEESLPLLVKDSQQQF